MAVAAWSSGHLYRRGEVVTCNGVLYQAATNIETDAYPPLPGSGWVAPDPITILATALNTDGTLAAPSISTAVGTLSTGGGPHVHVEADVTALPADLAAKATTAHNHDASYAPTHSHPYAGTSHAHVDGDLPAGLARDAEVAAGYSALGHGHVHTHPESDVTSLTSDLAAKAASVHSHAEADVTSLVSDLAGKSGTAHTHAYAATSHAHLDADLPAGIARDAEVAAAVTAHEQAGDPHPTYLTSAEGSAAYATTAHVHAPVHTVLANDTLTLALGTNTSVRLTVTANRTLTTTVPAAGSTRVVLILTASASSFTITFGTGFKPVTTLATGTTTARVFAVSFISDGTNLYETGRTAAMVA